MLMDFIFGKPAESQTGLNERSQALNDLLLDQILNYYQQGPNPLPTYTAMAPDLAYSAPNTLLASLGLESVSRPDLPTTEIGGRTVYTSQPLQAAIEEKFAEENPELYARLKQQIDQRMNPMPSQPVAAAAPSSGGGGSRDPLEIHRQILADRDRAKGIYSNSLTTGGPSSSSQHVFATADLYGNHGGSHVNKIADDLSTGISNFKSGGGIFGAIANALSGNKKKDDPSIGNVP